MRNLLLHILLVGFLLGVSSMASAQCDDMLGGMLTANDSTPCISEQTVLKLNNYVGDITWEKSSDGLTWEVMVGAAADSIVETPTTDAFYRVEISRASCPDLYSSIVEIDVQTAGVSEEGYSLEECGVVLTNPLFALTITSGAKWIQKVGPGESTFFPNDESNSATVEVSTHGFYVFAWTVPQGGCVAANVLFSEQNTAVASNNIQFCGEIREPVQLEASLSNSSAEGEWITSGGGYSVDDVFDPNTTVTPTIPGTYSITWRETSGACSDDTTITFSSQIQPVPQPINFTPSCNTVDTLESIATFANVHYWKLLNGPGTMVFSDSSDWSPQVSVDMPGDYELRLFTQNDFCADSAEITASFVEQPIANAANYDDACGDTVYLNAIKSIDASDGEWRYLSGPNSSIIFDDFINNETWVSADGGYGTYELIWEETNGICSDRDTVAFSFVEWPVANAGDSDSICGLTTTIAALPSIENSQGMWTAISNSDEIEVLSSNTPISNVNAASYKSFLLQWTEDNAGCVDHDTILLGFFEQPTVSAGANDDTCGLQYQLNAIRSVDGAEFVWQALSKNAVFIDSTSATTNVTLSQSGTYSFICREMNVLCIHTDTTDIAFYEMPVADPGVYEDVCGVSFQLNAIDNGVAGEWSAGSTASFAPSASAFSPQITVSDTGVYTINWKVDNGYCSSDSTFSIHFIAKPEVNVNAPQTICGESAMLQGEVSIGKPMWTVVPNTSDVSFANPASPSTTVNIRDARYGSYRLLFEATNFSCSDTASTQVTFLEPPNVNAGVDTQMCGFVYVLEALPHPGTGLWILNDGPGTVTFLPDNSALNAELEVSQSGVYELVRAVSNGVCEDADTVQIQFKKAPLAQIDSIAPMYNKFETPLRATEIVDDENGMWSVLMNGTGRIAESSNAETTITELSLGENLVLWQVSNGYCIDEDTASIVVYDIFIPEIITPNGDGSNDYFEILGIEDLTNVKLVVYNRWGTEVYENTNYAEDNNWDATNKSGAELTNDTYFYVLTINNSNPIKGFVVIKE